MTQVLVTGATGTLGRVVLPRLVSAGHEVRAVSRRPRPGVGYVEWAVADLRTGSGVTAAVDGVGVIVHCASAQRGDGEAAQHLLETAGLGGASPHVVYISIVGVDRVPLGYYRTKLAVEQLVAESGLPYTILRATQFHDLVLRLFTAQRRLPAVLVPAATGFQPTDADEVAASLARCVADGPAGRVDDIGGPEIVATAELARRYLRAAGRRRLIVPVPIPGAVGRAYRAGRHLAPDHAAGRVTFDEFLARTRTG